jgi:hypothetical protein
VAAVVEVGTPEERVAVCCSHNRGSFFHIATGPTGRVGTGTDPGGDPVWEGGSIAEESDLLFDPIEIENDSCLESIVGTIVLPS